MIIAMTISMSGGRYDDRPWPGIRIPFEVPDDEAEGLIRWNHAVKVRDSPKPVKEHVTAPAPVSLPAQTAAGPVPEPAPVVQDKPPEPAAKAAPDHPRYSPPDAVADEDPDPEPDLVIDAPAEPPKPADPKQDWIDYAVTGAPADKRIPRTQAEALTKADLMSRFGGRL